MAGVHEYIYKLQSVRPGKVSLAEVLSFYSTFAGAFVLIMQTDEGSPPPRGEQRVDPCLRAEGLKTMRSITSVKNHIEEHNLGKKSH
jgi:hypothetical protein